MGAFELCLTDIPCRFVAGFGQGNFEQSSFVVLLELESSACYWNMGEPGGCYRIVIGTLPGIVIGTLPGIVIGTLPGMVIGTLPGMVIGTLPGMVIGGAAPACFKKEVELVNIQREGGAWKGGNLNVCGVLDVSPNFVFQAASCLHCFSTLLFSFFFFPR